MADQNIPHPPTLHLVVNELRVRNVVESYDIDNRMLGQGYHF
jgi:hypothetical protein